tara:strand:+ start:91 stop:234 length:144 start_codon:yes stop_codon:yes gene_type:complete
MFGTTTNSKAFFTPVQPCDPRVDEEKPDEVEVAEKEPEVAEEEPETK